MKDSSRDTFPAENLAERLSKRLFSRKGVDGISALIDRLSGHWPNLLRTWLDRKSPDGAATLGLVLRGTVQKCYSKDLYGVDIRLHQRFYDPNVESKLGLTLLEMLADDSDSIIEAVEAIGSLDEVELVFYAHLIAVPLYLERKQFDLAIAAAKANWRVRFCPFSEYLLYQSVKAKKEAGLPVTAGDVAIHDMSDRFCNRPFEYLATSNARGFAPGAAFYACECAATLNFPLAYEESDLSYETIWNGDDIREIRRSILDGDFSYCSRAACMFLAQGTLPKRSEVTDPFLRDIIDNNRTKIDRKPAEIIIGHDTTCNLACPSCRKEILAVKNEEREKFDELADKIILPLMADSSTKLFICSDGDPFASKHYRRIMHNLDPERHRGVTLRLLTNGILFTADEWDALGHVQKQIESVTVSIDGASQDSYENLRRPGKWSTINMNMELLKGLRSGGKIPRLVTHFVVQKDNFEEMPEFVKLSNSWNVDYIFFFRLNNPGSFTPETFLDKDVSDPRHPFHSRLLHVLRHPILHESNVCLPNLVPLQKEADAMTECMTEQGKTA